MRGSREWGRWKIGFHLRQWVFPVGVIFGADWSIHVLCFSVFYQGGEWYDRLRTLKGFPLNK